MNEVTKATDVLINCLWDFRNEDHSDTVVLSRDDICLLLDRLEEIKMWKNS